MKNILLLFISSFSFILIGKTQISVDLYLKNLSIIDGTGTSAFKADIGIKNDKIIFIGQTEGRPIQAKKTINFEGYTAAPGFIDPHTHTLRDLSDSNRNKNLSYLFQGVTTVLTGNDGGSVVHIGKRLERWQKQGLGTNAGLLVGHRTLRKLIVGMDNRPPTEEEMMNMKNMLRKGLQEGAIGFSSGLYYAPASFATTKEVIELCKVAAEFDAIYDVHIRDESTYNIGLLAAIEETIEIAQKANIKANVSHIKALGVDVWGQSKAIIQRIETARKAGIHITADQYPYQASGTHLDRALLPKWVFADVDSYQEKLKDANLLPSIKEGLQENLRKRGGASSILLTAPVEEAFRGMTLAEVADSLKLSAIDAALHVLHSGSSAIASFNMKESDIQNFMRQPWIMTCSDGSNAHPRKYGTYPKKIREYVLEKQVLSLEEMIRKSSSLPAQIFGIPQRGTLKEGYFADLIIFKVEEIKDNATFEQPDLLAEGMHYVIVNGKIVIEEGEFTGKLAGIVVKRAQKIE